MFRFATAAVLAFSLAACNDSSSDGTAAAGASGNSTTPQESEISFASASYTVTQDAKAVSIVVNRTGNTAGSVSVSYGTVNGTAASGSDYSNEAGMLVWAENDVTPRTVTVQISNATPFAGVKTFEVTLTLPSAGAQIANPGSTSVTISGDAVPAQGTASFSGSTYQVAQNGGSVTVTVNRGGDSTGSASVAYATQSGTAVAGTEFTATGGTVSWADGDAEPKTFNVAVSNATPFTGDKTFNVALSNPTGITLATPDSAVITIVGDGSVATTAKLELMVPSKTVAETAGSVALTVMRTGGSSGSVSVAYATVSGTAVAGTNFAPASGTLTWSSGDTTSKTINVALLDKTSFAGNKSFSMALSKPSQGATIANPGSVTVTVAGDASLPVGSLELSAASYSTAQSGGAVTVMVNRVGGSSGAVSVNYQTIDGTAIGGTDYTAETGTLQWADGDATAKTFSVPVSNASPFSGTKSFTVSLSQAGGGATLGSPVTAGVAIAGDAASAVGSVQLAAAGYTVSQGAGSATITVNRTGGSSGAISVAYATVNGTAVAGTDFTASSGTLSWASGDAAAKTFTIPISNANPSTGTKTFSVSLSSPNGGTTLATPSTATVSITGDGGTPVASPGTIELSATSYAVEQSSGSLTITVIRSGGSSGAASIHYATAGGTATAGTDFTAASGTLSWASGDASSKTFTVAISTATPFSGTKSFTVTLSAVSGGTLGTPASSTVTISGSSVASNGGTAPSAPSSLTMVAQGLNTATLSWSVAAPGAAPIAHYNIYRNGSAYATSIATTYIDTNATNTNSPETGSGPLLTVANTVYTYAVSAVDTAGNEGPLQSNLTYWVYYNGIFDWLGDYSYPGGQININYADTTGAPEDGPADIKITSTTTAAGWLPYAGKTTTQWDLDGGAFNYISLDLKPTLANQDWQIFILCRLPPGDNAPWSSTVLSKYGPAPVVGQWATYKIPLSVLTIGYTNFIGSIKGNTLTVTSVTSGVGLDAGGYITGPGIPAGTYLTTYNQQGGGVGTYTVGGPGISSSTNIASTSMVEQRNGIYKFALVDRNASNPSNNAYYVDNVKFTVD